MFETVSDRIIDALDNGYYHIHNERAPAYPMPLKLDRNAASNLKQAIKSSTRIRFTKSSLELMNDIIGSIGILDEAMPTLHLPYPKVFFDIPTMDLGFLLSDNGNREITIEMFDIDNRSKKLCIIQRDVLTVFKPLDSLSWDSSYILPFLNQMANILYTSPTLDSLTAISTNSNSALVNGLNTAAYLNSLKNIYCHFQIILKNPIVEKKIAALDPIYKLNNDFFLNGIKNLTPVDMKRMFHAFTDVVSMALFPLAGMYLLDQKSHIPVIWTHNVRNSQGLKKGITYSILDVDVNAKTYLPKPIGIPVGNGAKKREHKVRETWCVSHTTGKNNCKGICKPVEIDERRVKCLNCGKKSWLRRAHDRGDSSLGQVIKEYKSIVS